MPRTPLLQQVVSLARGVARSDASGVPVDEVLDGAPSVGRALDRRAFLGAAGAVALGAGLSACADGGVLAPAAPRLAKGGGGGGSRVAIVGAGLAGLTCAHRLRQAGVVATVYEGSARVGGRCWTRRGAFDEGQIVERGGELIDQGHTAIRQLAQQLGLRLDNVLAAEAKGTEARYRLFGADYTARQAARDLQAHVWQPLKRDYVEAGYPTLHTQSTARGRELDAMSIAQWIDARVPGGRGSPLGRLLEIAYVIEYGAEAAEQSALNLVYLLGGLGQGQLRLFGPSNEKYKVRGGNDLLVQGLAAALPGQIETDAPLSAVVRAGSRWTLRFRGRPDVTVDRVVLALPFSVLRERVDVEGAGFSAVKRTAIRELGMGANGKLALQFRTRHWTSLGCNGETIADTGYQHTWEVTRAQPGRAGILVNYTGGAVAREQSGRMPAQLVARFLDQVAPVLPGLGAAHNGKATFDDWLRHEWTLGSYSFWKPGQYTRFAGAEGEPADGCHFAGEHTSVDYQGYLNGAVESGERTAREVLAGLGVVKKA